MSDIANLLRKSGYKFTNPRRVVAKVIEEKKDHLTANEIWEFARELDDTIGRMSVYRALELFTQLGIIRPSTRCDNSLRTGVVYVMMEDGHHHHIVCQVCCRVIHFEDCGLEQLVKKLESTYGCHLESHMLEFFGICANCLADQSKES